MVIFSYKEPVINCGEGGGALQNGREGGWQVKFYPNKKGAQKSFSHVQGGGTQQVFR